MVCLCGGEFSTQTMLVQHAHDRGHLLRCSCHRLFATLDHLQNHERDTHPQHTGSFDTLSLFQNASATTASNLTHICPVCKQTFRSGAQLEGHQQATLHCYCAEHSLAFASTVQLGSHLRESLHVTSFECTSCDRSYRSNRALIDHLDSVGHANVEEAIQARATTATRATSNAQGGSATPDEEANLRCAACPGRTFMHVHALRQHKRSVKHNPLSDLRCPMSEECTQTFTSPSALLFHLEGGNCKSGMNRAKVDMLVHQHDTARQITSSANIRRVTAAAAAATTASLGSHRDLASQLGGLSIRHRGSSVFGRVTDVSDADSTISDNDNGVPLYTPTTSVRSHSNNHSLSGDSTPRQSSRATSEWSFINEQTNRTRAPPAARGSSSSSSTLLGATNVPQNLLCPVCDKSFRLHTSLVKHLESAAHASKLYHCPTGLALLAGRHSAKSFKTMSGVLQHLEAGACVGGREALDQIFTLLETKIAQVTGTTVRLLRGGHP